MTTFEPFETGDTVLVVYKSDYVSPKRDRIKRITKRFIELDGGEKFSLRGYPYPKEKYPTKLISKITDSNFDLAEELRLRGKVKKWIQRNSDLLNLQDLRKINEIIIGTRERNVKSMNQKRVKDQRFRRRLQAEDCGCLNWPCEHNSLGAEEDLKDDNIGTEACSGYEITAFDRSLWDDR